MERALRWLIAVLIGLTGVAFAWWGAASWFGLSVDRAVAIAALMGSILAAPFLWWATQEPKPRRKAPVPPTSSSGHVFMCYSHEADRGYAQRLAAHLAECGVPSWYDRDIVSGSQWAELIPERIDACAAFVVLMTPQAEKSKWVNREIARAEERDKPILPLRLAGGPFFRLSNLHYEDVSGGQMPGQAFVDQLKELVGEPEPEQTTTPTAAPSALPAPHTAPAERPVRARRSRRPLLAAGLVLLISVAAAAATRLGSGGHETLTPAANASGSTSPSASAAASPTPDAPPGIPQVRIPH